MAPQHLKLQNIMSELESHNSFFDDLVDMIPSKLYVAGNSGDDAYNPKYGKGQSKESKESRRARNKLSKLRKFDPDQSESTREEKLRLEREADAHDSDDEQMEDIHFEDNHEEESAYALSTSKEKNENSGSKQSRIEELRARLRAKLEERKQSTFASEKNDSMISKRAARRAEKQKKIELAKKKKSSSTSTINASKGVSQKTPIAETEKTLGIKKSNFTADPTTVADDLSGIDFGAIAGLKTDFIMKGDYSSANKSLKNMGKKKSLERLLSEAEAKKERLRQLKESDDVYDKEKAKQLEWTEALKLANGENMRTADPALLKKALKRKAKKKAKSQESWKSRMEQTKEKMDERIRIKSHNKKQRALGGAAGANLSKKRIKDTEGDETKDGDEKKKKARLGPYAKGRAGFEGKKNDFINKGATSTAGKEKQHKLQQ
jgi:DNA excision repair protein ERCC-4